MEHTFEVKLNETESCTFRGCGVHSMTAHCNIAMCVCICVYIYIYIYVCVCVCVCVYTHTKRSYEMEPTRKKIMR